MTNRELFEKVWEAHRPEREELPEVMQFHKAWDAVRSIWGREFIAEFHSAVHQICGWNLMDIRINAEQCWELFVKGAKAHAEKMQNPEAPMIHHFYRWLPQEPGEKEAYEFFKTEFKRAYPDQRLNSKFAKKTWAEKKEKAIEIVRENWRREVARYEREKAEVEDRNNEKRREWQAKVDKIALFRKAVNTL